MSMMQLWMGLAAIAHERVRAAIRAELIIEEEIDFDALTILDGLPSRAGVGVQISERSDKSMVLVFDTERDEPFDELKTALQDLDLPFDEEESGDNSEGAMRYFRPGGHAGMVMIDDWSRPLEPVDHLYDTITKARQSDSLTGAIDFIESECQSLRYWLSPLDDVI